MARRGDEMAARAADGGRLRASHADREQVIGTLKAAFVQGLLDKDEFDLRVGQTFGSRTFADLAAVTADIPAGLSLAQPPEPTRTQNQQPLLRPGQVIRAASLLYAGVWAALILTPLGNDPRLVFALVWTATLTYLGALLVTVGAMLELRRKKRSGGQLPPGQRSAVRRSKDKQDSGIGDDLTLSEARSDVRAHHLPGHGVTQRSWRSLTARRDQRRPAGPQVTA
jgi:hypothetical protein